MDYRKIYCLVAGLAALFVSGCSGGADVEGNRLDVYPITGKITMNGAPVADAAVSFSPKGAQPPAIGRTDANGVYTLRTYEPGDGAAAGEFVVLVSKQEVSAAPNPGLGHDPNNPSAFDSSVVTQQHAAQQQASKSLLPEKYSAIDQSDLTATVSADGPREFNFDLKE